MRKRLNMGFWNKKSIEEQEKTFWDKPLEEEPVAEIVSVIVETQEVEVKNEKKLPVKSASVKVEVGPRKITSRIDRTNRLDVNARMELMVSFYMAIINGVIKSLIVQGGPGLGKTYMLMQCLKKAGMVEGKDYLIIKAGVSAFGCYTIICKWSEMAEQALQDNKSKGDKAKKVRMPLLIFDDVPMFVGGEKRLTELIKAITDSSGDENDGRKVSWLTAHTELDPEAAKAKGKLPSEVIFKGGVIIITNEEESKISKPLKDRALYLPLAVSDEEMMVRMQLLGPKMGPNLMDAKLRQQVVDWLCSNEFEGDERSMRTLHKALNLAAANPKNWKNMCQIL